MCRRLFARAGINYPLGSENLTTIEEAIAALGRMRAERPSMAQAIVKLNEGVSGEGNATVDLSKMNDKEIDEYMLKQRVEYQKVRPLLELVFNDLKIKTVLHLPGDIVEVKGFQKDGRRTVSQSFEGAALLAVMKKIVMMDSADVKKLAKSRNKKDLMDLIGPLATLGELDVTLNNLGGPQFDYDKEVRDARAAYPGLRRALGLDESVKLPGE